MSRPSNREQRRGEILNAFALGPHEAGAVLAFIIGALVLGAFAPQKTAGFAAPALRTFVAALRKR